MDFSLTEEQAMLQDSVARFIDNDYAFEIRQQIAEGPTGYSEDLWRQYADLGWTAVPFPEEDGGLDGGPVELMLLMEQFGRGLVLEPYLATVVLTGGVLTRAGNAEQKARWLGPIIRGELQGALAFTEPQARFEIADIATTAVRRGAEWLLNGRKAVVLNGGAAELFVVPARTAHGQRDAEGVTLFAVPADTPGLFRQPYRTVDGQRAAEIVMHDVRVGSDAMLGQPDNGFAPLQSAIDAGTLAVSAEAVGIMQAMHEKTVEYTKTRTQFGVPIGTFQALQHRMVDMLIACEQCRSLLLRATMLAAPSAAGVSGTPTDFNGVSGTPTESDGASGTPTKSETATDGKVMEVISALKYQVSVSGRLVAQEAVQLHGGMGMTWELDIAHYFKRLTAIEVLFGNADFHLDRYLALSAST